MRLPAEVAVVGAGAMGAGIARVFADAGASVRLCARRESSLEAARPRLGDNAARVRMTTSADDALAGAELVIETIVEELEPKRELLTRAEELAAPDCDPDHEHVVLAARPARRGASAVPSASRACTG